MKTTRAKLTFGLAALVAVLMLAPSVQANTAVPDVLSQILAAIGAIQAKTDHLPADPAATSDVTAAKSALSAQMAALSVSGGFRRAELFGSNSGCDVVPGPTAGRVRAVTLTAMPSNMDANLVVFIEDSHGSDRDAYSMNTTEERPTTFVESLFAGEVLRFCNTTPNSFEGVSAIWTEGPAS